jgi:hypothetical protein
MRLALLAAFPLLLGACETPNRPSFGQPVSLTTAKHLDEVGGCVAGVLLDKYNRIVPVNVGKTTIITYGNDVATVWRVEVSPSGTGTRVAVHSYGLTQTILQDLVRPCL